MPESIKPSDDGELEPVRIPDPQLEGIEVSVRRLMEQSAEQAQQLDHLASAPEPSGSPFAAFGGRGVLGAGHTRLEKGHRRQLATAVGPVTVTRCVLRGPGLPNCYPADRVLGLPRERHSLGLRRLAVLEAARGSYDHALEAIERRCGTRAVGKRQAEQLVRAAAVDIAAFYAARTTTHTCGEHDAAGAQHRRQGDRDAPGPSSRGDAEGSGACDAHVPHPVVRRREDLPQADGHPGRRPRRGSGSAPAARHHRPAPRPHHPPHSAQGAQGPREWLTASVQHDATHVIAAAFDQAEARDQQHRRCWVVLVDGAEHQLELIHAEAARRGVTIHVVLDIST